MACKVQATCALWVLFTTTLIEGSATAACSSAKPAKGDYDYDNSEHRLVDTTVEAC